MRLFLLLFFTSLTLFAEPRDIRSFHAQFIQTIIDDSNKKLIYQGEIWASTPQNALWVYTKPIKKSVFINGSKLTLIEPQLEQVTLKNLNGEIDFLQIIKKAKPLSNSRYSANVNGEVYTIDFVGEMLSSIRYEDNYDNKVTIKFLNPVQNKPIESSVFKPVIPQDFDIIRG